MKLKVFSIYDEKALVYRNPFFMAHDGQALRAFGDLVGDKDSEVAKHPEDYTLYRLGEYDDCSGVFESLKAPVFMSRAVDFVPGVSLRPAAAG